MVGKRAFKIRCGLLAGLLLFAAAGMGQTFYARLTGTITDASKAVVPGATITLTNVDTNDTRTTSSDASGVYNIPALPPGIYTMKVESTGFQPVTRKDVRLETNQVATMDVELKLGTVAQAIEVTAEVPILQTETSSYGSVLESRLVREFPLLERDVMGLLNAFPGVITPGGGGTSPGNARATRNVFDSNFSVAGGRSSTNEVLIDGAPNTIGDFNGVVIVPPVDSVAEFKLETSTYSAEFGRSGGGVVNMVTKSGSNEFHGSLYEYFQNTILNANSFVSNRRNLEREVVKRNQYGGTLGGPLRIPKLYNGKDKTFFFFDFEGRRERNPVAARLFSLPTELERRGDFSQTFTIVGGQPRLVQIYDPFSTRLLPNGRPTRDPLTNNTIPTQRLNPIALKILSFYPAPNRPGDPFTNRNNYFFQSVQTFSRDLIDGRVDHIFSQKHRLFGRFSWQENLAKNPGKVVAFASRVSVLDTFRNLVLDDTYTLTPRLLNNFRYSYARFRANQFPRETLGFDPTTLGLPNYIRDSANVLLFPNFTVGSPFPDLGSEAYNNQPRDTQGFQNQLVWTRGGHTIRPGFEYRLYRFHPFQVFNPTGAFSFGPTFTQQDHLAPASPTQGLGLASFLLGAGAGFNYEHVEPVSIYHHYFVGYLQDDWKVTSRLTLNLGLRWDLETGTAESHGRLTYFDPTAPNPVSGITLPDGRRPVGALQFTKGDRPRSVREANKRNFAPRLGFAYRMTRNMSMRGGYGIFYLPTALEAATVSTPFNYTLSAAVTDAQYRPAATLSDPFPGGIQFGVETPQDGSYLLGRNALIMLRKEPAPYMHQWNFGIARQMSRTMVVDVTYYGSRGVHLPLGDMEFNQLDSKYLARGGAYLTERVPNPFFGTAIGGPLVTMPTVMRMQLLKPFPQFAGSGIATNAFGGSLLRFGAGLGESVYHALTFKVEKRYSEGLSVNAHYTISKLIDIGRTGNGARFLDPSAIRDIYNIDLERSLSGWDVPQRLVVTYNLELPFGRGKLLLKDAPAWVDHIVGGWSIHSFHTWQSGRPIAVGGTDLSRLAGQNPSRANVVPGVDPKFDLATSRSNARDWNPVCNCTKPWFNTTAFRQAGEFTIPNGPRFLPTARQDNLRNWDMSLRKNIRLSERFRMQASGGFFNLLNQVQFGASDGNVNSSTFGSTTGVANSPRRVELGLKVSF